MVDLVDAARTENVGELMALSAGAPQLIEMHAVRCVAYGGRFGIVNLELMTASILQCTSLDIRLAGCYHVLDDARTLCVAVLDSLDAIQPCR